MQRVMYASSLPATLSFYHGGLFLGVFYPGPPVYVSGSELFGNRLTGKAQSYRASGERDGEKGYGWAIIIAPNDIQNFITRRKNESTRTVKNSIYDGFFNLQESNASGMSRVSSYKKGGYLDWYIPSVDELAFIAKNLPQDFGLGERFIPMNKTNYLSSTYKTQNLVGSNKKNTSLLLSQSFDSSTYGDTILVSDTKPMSVRLIRKVPVYII
jgi:hypothetical protein